MEMTNIMKITMILFKVRGKKESTKREVGGKEKRARMGELERYGDEKDKAMERQGDKETEISKRQEDEETRRR